MSAWIKSHQTLRDHPRKDKLTEALFNGMVPDDVADYAAIGLLHQLWWWALDYAQDGDLSQFSDRQIAKACRWRGEAKVLVDALTASGFITDERTLHDWDDYAGKLIERRERNRERMREVRSLAQESVCSARAAHVQRTCAPREEKSRGKPLTPLTPLNPLSDSRESDGAISEKSASQSETGQLDSNNIDDKSASESATRKHESRDFTEWWTTYGKVGSRADAETLYRYWRGHGATADELLSAAIAYRDHCAATDCKMQHARTFLARSPCRWREWADGEDHGTMDVRASRNLEDVLEAGAEAFGLANGGNGERRRIDSAGGSSRAAAGGAHARRRLPAPKLASGE